MKQLLVGVVACFAAIGMVACAPVKFTKSETQKVDDTVTGTSITCNPRISPNLTTYTYASTGNPSLLSNCTVSNLNYDWVIKRSDSSIVSVSISGLSGASPANIDLRVLGEGTYYIFLTASDPTGSIAPYTATTPLELVVPGSGTGNSLTCDPKLNGNQTSVTLNSTDSNPTVSANCTPAAGSYIWTVTKDGVTTTIAGLSGASSSPNIKSYGAGVYRISLYATATGSAHWQTTSPLVVTVNAPPQPETPILCNPKINGSLNAITLTTTTSNPLISANCIPVDVIYGWRVTKGGNNISVPALNDANSNPDFSALGNGTYLVYLTATKTNYTTWNTTTPLTITVDNSGVENPTIDCSPRLNTDSTAITITSATGNPTVKANCNPTDVTYTWSVYKNNAAVSISGIGGATSTPNFIAAGLGTYQVYLTAEKSGYNAYNIPTPLVVTVAQVVVPTRRVTLSKNVQVTDNKVDIVLIIDDSNSMLPDNTKLAQKLQGFVNNLSSQNVDWQMCATVTRSQKIGDYYYWGASRNWVDYLGSPKWILNNGATNPYASFTNTIAAIGAGWAGTDDERGIKAAYWHAEYATNNSCYRNDASLSVIMISDEDIRSVGGDAAQVYYGGELKTLEGDDLPQAYVNKIKQKFGLDKRFTVNSIIVKPGDSACMATQDADGANAKSHYGKYYAELSNATNGYVGSICDADYSTNLNYFRDRIVSSLSSIPLECAPVGGVDVTVTPSISGLSTRIENNTLIFAPAVPAGYNISVGYDCPQN